LKQFGAAVFTTDADWGTDNFDFMLRGVPTFVANQEEYNYLLNYHAMSDTLDKVDLPQLKKHVAEAAGLTFGIANSSSRPGPRLHHDQIEQTLRETHLDEQLKTFGMWGTGKAASEDERTRIVRGAIRLRQKPAIGRDWKCKTDNRT
jgi:hypothetical protein